MLAARHLAGVVALVVVLLAVSACGSSDEGATDAPTATSVPTATLAPTVSAPPTVEVPPTVTSQGVEPEGFGTIAAVMTPPDGESCEVCLWLAETPSDRGRGLMGVTDLGGRDGMAFVYDQPTATSFTMRNTLLPLSIVFYGPDGAYLDAFDMTPCEAEPCPSYPTPGGFTVAVEVPRGGAAELGMVPGSRIELLATACP